jgi:hypothetical protein
MDKLDSPPTAPLPPSFRIWARLSSLNQSGATGADKKPRQGMKLTVIAFFTKNPSRGHFQDGKTDRRFGLRIRLIRSRMKAEAKGLGSY